MATVTGTTEHLEQIVRDMEDAGPGATESRTYRAIVAELKRRANEEAPAENPVAATAGDEGQTHPNQQEGTDPMTTVQTPAAAAIDELLDDPRWVAAAERDRQNACVLDEANAAHPATAAPGPWFRGEVPEFDMVTKAGDPVRAWTRDFTLTDDPFGVTLYVEDTLTDDGLVRSPIEVLVDTAADGLTPAAARELAAAISRALAALEGGGR